VNQRAANLKRMTTAALLATALTAFWFQPATVTRAAAPVASSASLAPAPPQAMSEIRALFTEYLRLHAAKDMDKWKELFLPEANATRTTPDGAAQVYPIAELARIIGEEAQTVKEQRETFDDTRIEVHANAALYAANWTLFHDGKMVRQGRAFFSLVKKEGSWKIAALVWHRD
jgi:hypothetical protein